MWHTLTKEEIAKKLKVDLNKGLTDNEAERRKEQYGPNKLQEQKRTNIVAKFIMQFKNFMILVLLFAAIISAVMAHLTGSRRVLGFYYNNCNCCI